MKKHGQISSLLSRYISVIIIICSLIAFFRNDTFLWTTKYTSTFLGVAMFSMGLTIRAEDLTIAGIVAGNKDMNHPKYAHLAILLFLPHYFEKSGAD